MPTKICALLYNVTSHYILQSCPKRRVGIWVAAAIIAWNRELRKTFHPIFLNAEAAGAFGRTSADLFWHQGVQHQ